MDIRSIKTFLTLAEVKRLSLCAELLCITKSAVSSRIKQLENQLDQVLFKRSAQGMDLTLAGERFYQHAQIMQQRWEHAKVDVKINQHSVGTLSISTHPTLANHFLVPWGHAIKCLQPNLNLQMSAEYSSEIVAQVAAGSLDIGLIFVADATTGLIVEQVFEDQLIMVSTTPCKINEVSPNNYLYIDWGWGYNAAHNEHLPHLQNCLQSSGFGEIALSWLFHNGGSAYVPARIANPSIEQNRLYEVTEAPAFKRPIFVTYPREPHAPELIKLALSALQQCV